MSRPGFHSRPGNMRSSLGARKTSSTVDHIAKRLSAIHDADAKRTEGLLAKGHERPTCPKCQKPMNAKLGPRGLFWGCQAYPACRASRELTKPPP